ncbi:MAG: MFS transporter [Candidatus Eremiobacteraeota bacterium]|nr:MFS transporter [Candidatus Eremiobacteraeota bacterium]
MTAFFFEILLMFKNRNIFITSFTFFLVVLSWFTWFPILPLHLRDLGANDVQVGITYALMGLAFSLFQVIGGIMSDRWGRKNIIVWPSYTFIVFYVLCGLAKDWMMLTFLLVISDSFSAIQMPSFSALTAESVPEEKRGLAFGMIWMGLGFGITVGPAIGAIALKYVGINMLFYFTAAIFVACSVLRHVFLTETHTTTSSFSFKGITSSISRQYLLFLGAGILFAITFNLTQWGPFITLFAKDVQKFDPSKIQLLFTASGIAAIFSSLVGGKLVDRFGPLKLMATGAILHCIIILVWTFSRSYLASILFFSMFRICFQVAFISYETLINLLSPMERRGTLVGIAGSLNGAIGATGPVIGSELKLAYGPAAPFYGALAFALACSVALGIIKKHPVEKAEAEPAITTHIPK